MIKILVVFHLSCDFHLNIDSKIDFNYRLIADIIQSELLRIELSLSRSVKDKQISSLGGRLRSLRGERREERRVFRRQVQCTFSALPLRLSANIKAADSPLVLPVLLSEAAAATAAYCCVRSDTG